MRDRIKSWFKGEPEPKRDSGIQAVTGKSSFPPARQIIPDNKQIETAVDVSCSGKSEIAYEKLMSGQYTNPEAQAYLASVVLDTKMALDILRKNGLCQEARDDLEDRVRTVRDKVISHVLFNPVFQNSQKIAVFLPDGAQDNPKANILASIMDTLMKSGKSVATFKDPSEDVTSFKVDFDSPTCAIKAARLDSLSEYFPDLILMPAVARDMAKIPDLRLPPGTRFNPLTGEPLSEGSGRYLMLVCFDYQVDESMANPIYAAMVSGVITEKRIVGSSRPPPPASGSYDKKDDIEL